MRPRTIWVDLVNSPHVLVLHPLWEELKKRQLHIVVTAKDHSQTVGLLHLKGIEYVLIGQHGGKTKLGKAKSLFSRVRQMAAFGARGKFDLSICHGSRELIIVSKFLGIPNVTMFDYEYSEHFLKNWGATLMMAPDVIPLEHLRSLGFRLEKIYQYAGLKEHIYLQVPKYDPSFLKALGIDPKKVIVVFRPPAAFGHYHNARSETLIPPLFRYLDHADVELVVIPRYPAQLDELKNAAAACQCAPIFIERPVDGPRLLAHADAVISGGGTMIREAAVLGTPAYSIFSGRAGAVDEYLVRRGVLEWISSESDLHKIRLEKKNSEPTMVGKHSPVPAICDRIVSLL